LYGDATVIVCYIQAAGPCTALENNFQKTCVNEPLLLVKRKKALMDEAAADPDRIQQCL